jgi:hypothetical protein
MHFLYPGNHSPRQALRAQEGATAGVHSQELLMLCVRAFDCTL